MTLLTRRSGLILGAGLILSGCERLNESESFRRVLASAETLTHRAQRLILTPGQLAREFRPEDRSPVFRSNGTAHPNTEEYWAHLRSGFADWRLRVHGLVDHPLSLSLPEIRRLPSRTQITRHDCVEGWSAIGQWTGVPLALLLKAAGVQKEARYAVFHCADDLGGTGTAAGRYYESVEMADALHPQTILAHSLNGRVLPVANGFPLRLRVERYLGYKHAKYVERIELVSSFKSINDGKGGFWEDRGYEWYAGI
jgi:DMSO/TMAO reductase YedYZ molybdopterin-dependent catalytic subunit